jgi:hypothetical protein
MVQTIDHLGPELPVVLPSLCFFATMHLAWFHLRALDFA